MIRRENRRNRKDFEFIKPQARVLVKPEVFESLLACGQLPKNPDPQILNICRKFYAYTNDQNNRTNC